MLICTKSVLCSIKGLPSLLHLLFLPSCTKSKSKERPVYREGGRRLGD